MCCLSRFASSSALTGSAHRPHLLHCQLTRPDGSRSICPPPWVQLHHSAAMPLRIKRSVSTISRFPGLLSQCVPADSYLRQAVAALDFSAIHQHHSMSTPAVCDLAKHRSCIFFRRLAWAADGADAGCCCWEDDCCDGHFAAPCC